MCGRHLDGRLGDGLHGAALTDGVHGGQRRRATRRARRERSHRIDGAGSTLRVLTSLELVVAGEDVVFEKQFPPGHPGRYVALPAGALAVDALAYVDGTGTRHSLDEGLTLPEAPGYTLMVDTEPVAGAVEAVELTAEP